MKSNKRVIYEIIVGIVMAVFNIWSFPTIHDLKPLYILVVGNIILITISLTLPIIYEKISKRKR